MTIVERRKDNSRDDKRKDVIVKTIIMLILALILFIFATIAWFAVNNDVGTLGMGVTAAGNIFELSVDSPYTTTPDYTSVLADKFGYDTTEHITGVENVSTKCLMVDETFDIGNRYRGLRPGSKGYITFNVVPKRAGTYTLKFDLGIVGYHAEFENDLHEIKQDTNNDYVLYSLSDWMNTSISSTERSNCAKAINYIKGHILLFRNRDDDGYYSGLIPVDDGFEMTFTFTQADVDNPATGKKPVTVYWIWPNTFGQIILDEGNVNLHNEAMFSSSQELVDGVLPRNELISYICEHTGYVFETANSNITNSGSVRGFIEGAMGSNPDNLIALSNGYNNADQIIGENTQIILAEIIASIIE